MNDIKVAIVLAAAILTSTQGCASKAEPKTPSSSTHPVTVASAEARACDVLLEVGDALRTRATFPDDVRGSYSQRGGRLAVSFIARADVPMSSAPFAVVVPPLLPTPKVVNATCYDRAGAPLAQTEAKVD